MFAHMLAALAMVGQPDLPVVVLTEDNTRIDRSCRVVVPPGTVIEDRDGNGVVHVEADGVTIEWSEGTLRGDGAQGDWDQVRGTGIVVDGRRGVTIRGARVHRFKCGIFARNADGLVLEGCDVSDGYAQRLRSTPQAEDGGDWLWPHQNEANEWLDRYGAGIYIEDSQGVTVRSCRARQRQNGIVLDTVRRSRVYDNDCSFLSGWGLAMWRCTDNVVSRNAFDFCVRGYSHGVYNRGQDSAGILFFEQNERNVIAENSATHGGDGLFAFAGLDALGERWRDKERQRLRRQTGRENVDDLIEPPPDVIERARRAGCNDNLFIGNDFSYAPAHGLELTFSFGNRILDNRMVGNAICGIWGGFSQDTLIAGNTFEDNGEMAYGLERGGINIEHGAGNVIVRNTFRNNRCGVHLWWDDPGAFLSSPWGRANYRGVADNVIAGNTFQGDAIALHLRDGGGGPGRIVGTRFFANDLRDVGEPERIEGPIEIIREGTIPEIDRPRYEVYGSTRPVGARAHLAGREHIVMTEWFPWDHESPLVRPVHSGGDEVVYEFFGVGRESVRVEGAGVALEPVQGAQGGAWRAAVRAVEPGVSAYRLVVDDPSLHWEDAGTLMRARWDVVWFPWTPAARGEPVPPPDLERWRAESRGPSAVRATTSHLRFAYGMGGPSDIGIDEALTRARLSGDYFGMIARTSLPLTPGRWRIRVQSDDGVRVIADGQTVIENWTHHGPTWDEGVIEVAPGHSVDLRVEHFEIFGYAVLELTLEPVP